MTKTLTISKYKVLTVLTLLSVMLLYCGSMARAQAGERQGEAERGVSQVVRQYLVAWQNGDFATMYRLWDAHSRQGVIVAQLRRAFTVDLTGTDAKTRDARRLAGMADHIVRGRPAAIVSVLARAELSDYATADCVARYKFQSQNGFKFSLLLPSFMQQLKADRTRSGKIMASVFPRVARDMDTPETVNTAKGQTRHPTHGQGTDDRDPPPYITLYFHRYVLVRELGDWRIANAVTVRDKPPHLFD